MKRFGLPLAVVFASFILASPLTAQTYTCQCNDGTYSNSCGEQGACSHHGGIKGGGSTPTPVYPPTSTRAPTMVPPPTATRTQTQTPTPSPLKRLSVARVPTRPQLHTPLNCPSERATVKLGTDADARLINSSSSTATTIEAMRSWIAPSIIPPRNRISPYETTVWTLDATLVAYKLENDSDFHLVLADGLGNTVIAEIVSPECAAGSWLAGYIADARAQFNARLSATTSFQSVNVPVRINGVGMFDFLHDQTGVAPNGIELHPVTSLSFGTTSEAK